MEIRKENNTVVIDLGRETTDEDLRALKAAVTSRQGPSRFAVHALAYFQPDLTKIRADGTADATAIKCKIVGVTYTPGKVLYDIVVADSESKTGFYEAHPMLHVDSFFIQASPDQVHH